MNSRKLVLGTTFCFMLAWILACGFASQTAGPAAQPVLSSTPIAERIERETLIPKDAVKMSPGIDVNPPLLYSDQFELPVPVPGGVNTAGAEDSVFITPEGDTMVFFFTPDVNVPVEKQVLDGVTGLYVSHKQDGLWGRPERIILQDPGVLALDGCGFVQADVIWFCSAREGYTGIHWFTAEFQHGGWGNWEVADFDPEYQVGELHFSGDGRELYFGSEKPGGKGGLDIWVSALVDGAWGEPINLEVLNTSESEGWPALNPAEDELWITRNLGLWRSTRVNGEWEGAELIVSPLAGEASLDAQGNLYFVHHYYVDGKMVEADIYVAYRK
jgi:hypothetical protein